MPCTTSSSILLIATTFPLLALGYQTAAPWRVALNIGQGFDSRMPVVVPCEFCDDGKVTPRSDTVSFTAIGGQVTKPVKGGSWSVQNNRNLDFSLEFPEKLQRNDVSLDGKVSLRGLVYTTTDLEALNQEFYDARQVEWKAMEQVDDIVRKREAPKKWDESSGQWVRAYAPESLGDIMGKQFVVFQEAAKRRQQDAKRPRPKDLSLNAGPLPGLDSNVYMGMQGDVVVKQGWRNVKIGTWSAEPINDAPRSKYENVY